MTRPIFFLTDFGLADTYVGVVKAAILGIAPDARIVDLTHDVPPQDIRAGAFALLTAVPYLPDDAVVLAVVDPGVGTARRPIAVQAYGRTFVGPDNGLLSWAIDAALGDFPSPNPSPSRVSGGTEPGRGAIHRAHVLLPLSAPVGAQGIAPMGGEVHAVELDRPQFWRPTISATFHGRDLFGPVTAHLARGVSLAEIGSPIDALQSLPFPAVQRTVDGDGRIVAARGEIVHIDRFGNLIANLRASDLPSAPIIEVAGRWIVGLAAHFQPPGQPTGSAVPIALIGSAGLLEIAVTNGNAATVLGVGIGAPVIVATQP